MNPFLVLGMGIIVGLTALFSKKETEEEKAEKEKLKLEKELARERELKTPIPTNRTVRDLEIEYKILENKQNNDYRDGKKEEYALRMERILGKIEYVKNNNAYKVQNTD